MIAELIRGVKEDVHHPVANRRCIQVKSHRPAVIIDHLTAVSAGAMFVQASCKKEAQNSVCDPRNVAGDDLSQHEWPCFSKIMRGPHKIITD